MRSLTSDDFGLQFSPRSSSELYEMFLTYFGRYLRITFLLPWVDEAGRNRRKIRVAH